MHTAVPAAGLYRARLVDLAFVLALVAGALVPRATAVAITGAPVLLNEVLATHSGTDTTEYFELYGVPGTSLAGLSLVAVDGDGATAGRIDRRVDLPATARLGGNGFYLVGNAGGLAAHYGVTPDLAALGNDSLPTGSTTLALVQTASIGAEGTFVTGGEVVLDAVGLRDNGFSDAWFFGAPVVGPDDVFVPAGLRRATDGLDTDTAADWLFADDLLGPANTPTAATPYNAPPVADCGGGVVSVEGVASSAAISAADPDGRVTGFSLGVAPVGVGLGAVTPAAAAGEPATTSLEIGPTTAAGSYLVTVTAWTDDAVPQLASCEVAVTVEAAPEPEPEPAPPGTSVEGLSAMLGDLVASGAVDASKAHVFTDRLERVERFLSHGQHVAAQAQLRAFANQLTGMSPKWVSADAAAALASAATALAETLASS